MSPVVDCFDGMIVSWTATHPDVEMVNCMLDMATTNTETVSALLFTVIEEGIIVSQDG